MAGGCLRGDDAGMEEGGNFSDLLVAGPGPSQRWMDGHRNGHQLRRFTPSQGAEEVRFRPLPSKGQAAHVSGLISVDQVCSKEATRRCGNFAKLPELLRMP